LHETDPFLDKPIADRDRATFGRTRTPSCPGASCGKNSAPGTRVDECGTQNANLEDTVDDRGDSAVSALAAWPGTRTALPDALEQAEYRPRLSLDKVRAFSRHRGINTLLACIYDRDDDRNQRSLADVVASTLQP
jgi:hypothetical protein